MHRESRTFPACEKVAELEVIASSIEYLTLIKFVYVAFSVV